MITANGVQYATEDGMPTGSIATHHDADGAHALGRFLPHAHHGAVDTHTGGPIYDRHDSDVNHTDALDTSHQAPNGTNGHFSTDPSAKSTNTDTSAGRGPPVQSTPKELEVKCGPLLNYRRTSNHNSANPIWHGSILLVTTIGQAAPRLQLRCLGPIRSGTNNALNGEDGYNSSHAAGTEDSQTFVGEKIYEDPRCGFWRFLIELPLREFEAKWEYHIPNLRHLVLADSEAAARKVFVVPSTSQSMRIMFHSCNGFSQGTDEEAWSGCALWNDVLRKHEEKPFHVMIGGGDQIYNDGVRVDGPLRKWSEIGNPRKRRDHDFNEELRAKCDDYYLENYMKWYSTEPFAHANGIIAQINVWDDHDIIDGFGSYTDHFMKCAVFRGIGGVSYKYYLLFQHHVPPPKSTFTTDSEATWHGSGGVDPKQIKDSYVMTEKAEDPSYLFGGQPGPYVEQKSRSIFCTLGKHIAFLGLDARTERTRHQVNYPATYDMLFKHTAEQIQASNGQIKHLILLLGVPIAYPRMVWLENIFTSPIIGPIRFLSRRFGVGGGFFNKFDGQVELLDDLDDHYAARTHKAERQNLILRLQHLSRAHSVRITILGGDVHLAALGRFYSKPKLRIPEHKDFRYMANVISSAITNHPPPAAVANLLARRNKIHHFDDETDETLLNMWDKDPGIDRPGVEQKTKNFNHCTMPSRNYAILCESHDPRAAQAEDGLTNGVNGHGQGAVNGKTGGAEHMLAEQPDNPRGPVTTGEVGCGTGHPAADESKPSGLGGRFGLDVCYRIEIDHSDRQGKTQGYGLTIPSLDL